MRYVYIISHGQIINDKYEFYRRECYSSLEKSEGAIKNILECNKAYEVQRDDDWDTDFVCIVDYKSQQPTLVRRKLNTVSY